MFLSKLFSQRRENLFVVCLKWSVNLCWFYTGRKVLDSPKNISAIFLRQQLKFHGCKENHFFSQEWETITDLIFCVFLIRVSETISQCQRNCQNFQALHSSVYREFLSHCCVRSNETFLVSIDTFWFVNSLYIRGVWWGGSAFSKFFFDDFDNGTSLNGTTSAWFNEAIALASSYLLSSTYTISRSSGM